MIDINRRQQLIAFIKEKRKATVSEIAQHLYISEATVRRDLNDLEKVKIVRRIHGAAVYIDDGEEVSTDVRETRNKKEKELISRYAVHHIPAFQTLFLDNSTTALYVVKAMELSEDKALLLSNRAEAYLKLGYFKSALNDCEEALKNNKVKETTYQGIIYIYNMEETTIKRNMWLYLLANMVFEDWFAAKKY